MKFLSASIPLFLLVLAAAAPLPAANDLQNEILGIKWESRISEIEGLSELGQKDSLGFFIKPGATATIFDTEVSDVVYGFYSGRFFAVYINIVDVVLFSRLKDSLIGRYGEPKIVQTMKDERLTYTWKTGKVKIKLKSDPQPQKMKLAFYYTPLSTDVNEAQAEETSEKAWQLFPIDKRRKPEHLPSIPLFNF